MKYTEVKNEKRLFLLYANSYAASIVLLLYLLHLQAAKGLSGLMFYSSRLSARQYDYKQYKLKNYSLLLFCCKLVNSKEYTKRVLYFPKAMKRKSMQQI